MGDIEFVILLVAAAAVCVRLAELIHVPYPIVLVLGGLALGLTPGLPDLELDPDIVLLVFLPPLLFSAAWYASPRELAAEARPLALLAVGLVLATMAAVAVVAHAIVPGMGWEAAFVLGAVVGPTDPVSATATFARIGAPARVRLLVEGEALINDATALVAFRVALAAAVEGTFSGGDAVLEFVVSAAGGIAIGIVVALIGVNAVRRQSDVALSIFFTVVTAWACYILAEEAHVSGVLAAVAGGMIIGWDAHRFLDPNTRLSGVAFWHVTTFGLEALLFILLGLQAPVLAEAVDVGPLVVQALVVAGVVVVVRMLFTLTPGSGIGDTLKERIAVGWAGMRGAISLAAALSIPIGLPERPQILLLTFGVILVTLVGQGLTLGPLLHRLALPGPNQWSPDEAQVRLETAQAALDRLEELEEEGASAEPIRRLRDLYRTRFNVCVALLGRGDLPDDDRQEHHSYGAIRRELIGVERATLLRLRGERTVGVETLRRVERDLDLEEARLRR